MLTVSASKRITMEALAAHFRFTGATLSLTKLQVQLVRCAAG